MHQRILVGACVVIIAGFGSAAQAGGPDDPGAATPPTRYKPVMSGMRSYRPVAPLPWGDVNRRVMPPEALSPGPEQNDPGAKPKHRP